jgi:hypothetical protein
MAMMGMIQLEMKTMPWMETRHGKDKATLHHLPIMENLPGTTEPPLLMEQLLTEIAADIKVDELLDSFLYSVLGFAQQVTAFEAQLIMRIRQGQNLVSHACTCTNIAYGGVGGRNSGVYGKIGR